MFYQKSRLHFVEFNMNSSHIKVKLFEQYRKINIASLMSFPNICEQMVDYNDIRICMENTDGFINYKEEAIR